MLEILQASAKCPKLPFHHSKVKVNVPQIDKRQI